MAQLELPVPGIGAVDAVKRFYIKYATFSGRASRSEYWWVQLYNGLIVIVLYVLMFAGGLLTTSDNGDTPGWGIIPGAILLLIFVLGSIVPGLALTVRRLHDANLPGPWIFIGLIPYLGGLVIFVMTLLPPNPLGVRFD